MDSTKVMSKMYFTERFSVCGVANFYKSWGRENRENTLSHILRVYMNMTYYILARSWGGNSMCRIMHWRPKQSWDQRVLEELKILALHVVDPSSVSRLYGSLNIAGLALEDNPHQQQQCWRDDLGNPFYRVLGLLHRTTCLVTENCQK